MGPQIKTSTWMQGLPYFKDDHIYYKVFPTSLKGPTLSWFTRLPLQSINSFETLKIKFAA